MFRVLRNLVLAYAFWLIVQDVSEYLVFESVEQLFTYLVEKNDVQVR